MIEDIKPPEPELIDTPVSAIGPLRPEAQEVGDGSSSS